MGFTKRRKQPHIFHSVPDPTAEQKREGILPRRHPVYVDPTPEQVRLLANATDTPTDAPRTSSVVAKPKRKHVRK